MKTLINTFSLIASLALAGNASAQTIYNINKNTQVSALKFASSQCNNCVINIADGVILTINQEIFLTNTVFNGGIIDANRKITFWNPGGEFNGTTVSYKDASGIVSSGELKINKSTFTFNGNSTATFWAPVTMVSSKMSFLDNASAEITSTFNLKNSSSLVAGDGTTKSAAFIKFNGGTLNEFDNSFVSVSNSNNYYYNWSNYNAEGKSVQSTNTKMNCGSGKNTCDAPVVYGPATLNFAGVASSAVLPVKLSAFGVKLNGSIADLSWTTDMEAHANRFEIERSFDGINWTKITSVAAKGNSSIATHYTYKDNLKVSGNVSYRLKMVDQDETSAYSAIRTVKSEGSVKMNIFPNPATNYVVISSKDNNVRNVQLINQNGQVVKQANGTGNVHLSVTEFSTGNYYIRVADNNGAAQTFKLMIAK